MENKISKIICENCNQEIIKEKNEMGYELNFGCYREIIIEVSDQS